MKRKAEKARRRKQRMLKRKKRIQHRLRDRDWTNQESPMFSAKNIHYDVADRDRGLDAGGIGLIHQLVRRVGLIDRIDERLELLKRHLPYHESDHVLNIAYNILAGGTCLDDIELRRNDEVYMDALGAQRIPDPTTEGDFCRRFKEKDVETLMDIVNETRLGVWRQQPESFFEEALIDGDGTLSESTGECKEGMDFAYNGTWGYHPLVISLANTQEPLFMANRSANRPSHEGAAVYFDRGIELCRKAGFRRITLRGDTDFSQTQYLDGWDEQDIGFIFGFDAVPKLNEIAAALPESAWRAFSRPPRYEVNTDPRRKPVNVKDRVIFEREYKNIRLDSEHVAEFPYRPSACRKTYRMVVLRKNLSVEKGEKVLFDDIRYFFFITNQELTPEEIVLKANKRCNQENLIEQLKNGVSALRMPVDDLTSNWAYMVMASLAWTLKAWFALLLPEQGRWRQKYAEEKRDVLRMEFKRFVNAFVRIPAQLVKTGRRLIFRLLAWNPYQHIFLRAVETLQRPLRC